MLYFTAAILFGLFQSFLDRADHVEGLFGNFVVFAFDDFLEAFDRIGNLYVLALQAGELLRDKEGLREESLNLARASTP